MKNMKDNSKSATEVMRDKLQSLKESGINPYPSKISIKGDLKTIDFVTESQIGNKVLTAGRVRAIRKHGGIAFFDLVDETGKVQTLFQKKKLGDDFETLQNYDVGDFLALKGEIIKTQAGELTINIEEFQIIGKALRPLPDSWFGLKDVEDRYRKRYLDLLFNPEVRERFNIRTKIIREVRRYLDNLGYWEVETPTLQSLYGGANAKPFRTHLNAFDVDMFLRIADELYLKRLLVGGYHKVYEICKDFRNEGVDLTHNPEFTMIEYYAAYSDYNNVMDVTESLFKHLAKAVFEDTVLAVGKHKVNIDVEWPRFRMTDLIKDKLGLDVQDETEKSLAEYCKTNNIEILGGETKGQLIYTIFEHKVTDLLIEPTWVIDYPKDVSPLSKDKQGEPGFVERFEGYIGGKEICDGWSELTDPLEQRKRFETDTKVVREDKEEAQQIDEDFLEAMEYGMPPIGGIGIGIDRLVMFFTNTWSIKEVVLYPTMKPKISKVTAKYDYRAKKILAVVDKDLPPGKVSNALGHLAFSAGHYTNRDFMGQKKLIDANGTAHTGIAKYPFIVLEADKEEISRIVKKAKFDDILVVDYPQEMFDEGDDRELSKAILKKKDFNYRAVVLVGDSGIIDKYTKNLSLYGLKK